MFLAILFEAVKLLRDIIFRRRLLRRSSVNSEAEINNQKEPIEISENSKANIVTKSKYQIYIKYVKIKEFLKPKNII
jgi:hypothetical protein